MKVTVGKELNAYKVMAFKMTHDQEQKGSAYVSITMSPDAAKQLRDDLIALLPLPEEARERREDPSRFSDIKRAVYRVGEGRPAALEGYPGLEDPFTSQAPCAEMPDSIEPGTPESVPRPIYQCLKCGAEIPPGRSFCSEECRTSTRMMNIPQAVVIFCPNCPHDAKDHQGSIYGSCLAHVNVDPKDDSKYEYCPCMGQPQPESNSVLVDEFGTIKG